VGAGLRRHLSDDENGYAEDFCGNRFFENGGAHSIQITARISASGEFHVDLVN
jgi:hypothetical protein